MCHATYGFPALDPAVGSLARYPAVAANRSTASAGGERVSTAQSALRSVTDDCPTTICGLNGAWLGKGFRFRTLHLDRTANPQGLTIKNFQWKGRDLELHVDGDVVRGREVDGTWHERDGLIGAELILDYTPPQGNPNDHPNLYTLRFDGFHETDFLAQPEGTGARPKVPLYQFTVTTGEGCKIELCKPGLADDFAGGMSGTAVIFRGDLYDEATFQVESVPVSPTGRGSIFNIACLGTAISKLHVLRHTAASQISSTAVASRPTVAQRQALLRLLTADYCGNGHPFTEDGLPIRLAFDSPLYRPTRASGYEMRDAVSIDARWDENGATCLGNPRWLRGRRAWTEPDLRGEIGRICGTSHVVPACPDTATPLANPAFSTGNYAISANPAVPVASAATRP